MTLIGGLPMTETEEEKCIVGRLRGGVVWREQQGKGETEQGTKSNIKFNLKN